MQSSLNAFNPSLKKGLWKVFVSDGKEKEIVFESAFSEAELRQKYPGAVRIERIEK